MPRLRNDKEAFASYLYELIVDNQAGEYEIDVGYRSKGKDVWNGTLTAPPIRLRIVEVEPFGSYLPKK